ncbi:PIN domain nuclease [Glycomyces paridis]|uniref:PIN domain nuclease n=1 Tax=Glycomyces paridis TaxID=2126555 RepID=UPI0013052516|nr:PIN domain nuclease [Glycomyces paridis]
MTRYLVDSSVVARHARPAIAERLAPLAAVGRMLICDITMMDQQVSARTANDSQKLEYFFSGFEQPPITPEVFGRAKEVQRRLVQRSLHRSVKIPDLILASAAELNGLTVLHYDKDFDRIAEVTGQPVEWVVPPGEADLFRARNRARSCCSGPGSLPHTHQ